MRKETMVLWGVLVASVILGGALARSLHGRQMAIASTRHLVDPIPLAGFQKFAADLQWLLYIQYSGSHDVNADSAQVFYDRLIRIIRLDPDFADAYHQGVLILGPVAPELALDIVNRGLDNPRLSRDWWLPMRAGQLLMHREKTKYYSGQPMDRGSLTKAKAYFRRAIAIHGAGSMALRSYIRASAALRMVETNGHQLELSEVEAWYEFWKQQRRRFDGEDMSWGDGEYGDHRMQSTSDVLLNQMRLALRRYPQPDADDPAYAQNLALHDGVRELVMRIVDEAFPDRRLDPVDLMPYAPGDLYSPYNGIPVEPYGICLRCYDGGRGQVVVLRGMFCHLCGEAAPPAVRPPPATRTRTMPSVGDRVNE